MAFSDAEKTDIRRFCGYPVFGAVAVQAFGHRFYQHYGTLEFRLNNLAAAEESVVRTTYLANLATLESAIPGSGANLDTDEAAVWKHNRDEVRDRAALFDMWRNRLCAFFGVPIGPNFGGNSGGTISLVV